MAPRLEDLHDLRRDFGDPALGRCEKRVGAAHSLISVRLVGSCSGPSSLLHPYNFSATVPCVATIREKRRGVWEVRVFTGRDENGKPTQLSRTVEGTKRDAMRVAAQFDSAPSSSGAGRTVAEMLDAWVEL